MLPDTISVRKADEPAARPQTFLETAEPLTVWRVDLAVLVGVADADSAAEGLTRG